MNTVGFYTPHFYRKISERLPRLFVKFSMKDKLKIGLIGHKEKPGLNRPYQIVKFLKSNNFAVEEIELDYSKLGANFRLLSVSDLIKNTAGLGIILKKMIKMSDFSITNYLALHNTIDLKRYIIDRATSYVIDNIKDINILHGETQIPAYICSQIKKELGIPYIFDMRGLLFEEQKMFKKPQELLAYYYHIEKEAVVNALKVVVVSKAMGEYIAKEYNCPREKITVIPNASDLYLYSAKYSKPLNIIYGGAFEYWERVEDYLKLAKFLEQDKDFTFYLMGDGMDRNKVIDYINDNYVNIYYLGRKVYEDSLRVFANMQVSVAPSSKDIVRKTASPVKIFDYAACGLPIVTVNAGEWSDKVKEYDCGIVVEDSNPKEFSEAIQELQNKDTWERKSTNGRRMIKERFNWSTVLKPLLDIFTETL